MTRKRATIIYNPMSGRPARRAENVRQMAGMLGECGFDIEARATTGPAAATLLATEAVAAGADLIISYGGDGTLNEVIQGMAGSSTALAVWPGGTSNVIARDLSVPLNISQLAGIIASGKTRRIALGLAKTGVGDWELGVGCAEPNQPSNPASQPLSRYFLMMAGIGLDASIARRVNPRIKRRTGEVAYWLSGIKHLFLWQPEPFVVEVDGRKYESTFALVGNGKGYGGGMTITPGAKLEEPWFEVYILPPQPNNFAYLRVLSTFMRGKPDLAGAQLVRATHVRANSAHEPWVEADGEIIAPRPMSFEIVPDALSIIVP